jgi:cytochrome b6-f complex iron-sulfur subunit
MAPTHDRSNPRRTLPTVSRTHSEPASPMEPMPPAMDRGTFLRTAGSAALLAALGITLPGCGGSDPAGPGGSTTPPVVPPTGPGGATPGLSLSGNVLTINLTEGTYAGLQASGGWTVINLQVSGRQLNVLAVNVDGTTIRAFSSVCPHAGCSTNWQYANDRFRCTCHDSIFENTGRRISGPATRDLAEFSASRSGNNLAVTLG